MSDPSIGLSRKMAGGAIWMLAARMLMRTSGLISVMVLARLLPPADFGVVGLTVAFIAAFEAMSDMSLTAAIVRHPDPKREHYNTTFTLAIMRGIFVGLLALLCSEAMVSFYGDERLRYVIWALAVQQVIFGFTNTGTADFQRNFTFGRDFVYLAVRKLGGSIVSITTALTIWPDYRALVAGLLAGSVTSVIASYILHPFRPRLSLAAFGEIFGFSKWMVATNLLDFLNKRCDGLIIGKTMGLTALGFHTLAMELANLVATEFAMPLRRATTSGFAKLQDDVTALRHQFCAAYGACMTIAVPFALGVGLVADPAIRLAFGADWAAAAAPLRILALYGLFAASVQFCWPLIISTGNPRRMLPLQLISVAFGAPAIWYASTHWGLVGAAWAMAAMGFTYATLALRLVLQIIEGTARQALEWLLRVLGAVLVMALSVRGLQPLLPVMDSAGTAALHLLISMIVGGIVYPTALLMFWHLAGRPESAEIRILRMAKTFLPRKLAGIAR